MLTQLVTLNNPQQISVLNNPVSEVDIWGRGTGKSFIVDWALKRTNHRLFEENKFQKPILKKYLISKIQYIKFTLCKLSV